MSGQVRVETNGPVATIVIENPAKRNALTAGMWQAIPEIVSDLESDDDVRVVVMRGAGDDFSAGADIGELEAILRDPATGAGGHVSAAEDAIASLSKPTVAAIDGYCVGGGWQIAGACDIRIATDRSTFGVTPARLGIVYPLSGIRRLVSIAGPAVAKYLLLTGEFVPAETALRQGLIADVLPAEGFAAAIDERATRLAGRSQLSVRAMKDLIDVVADGRDVASRHAYWRRQALHSDDAKIGAAAFIAGEHPDFTWPGPSAPQR